jgi:para-aminobenzoate synthetase component 1
LRFSKKVQLKKGHNIKNKLLKWSQQFSEVVWLDSNNYKQSYSSFDAVLAVDAFTVLKTDSVDAFDKLKEYQTHTKDWLFGYLTYDLKYDTENLKSINFDGLDFPDLFFFQPKKVFLLKDDLLEIQYLNFVDDELDVDFQEIISINDFSFLEAKEEMPKLKLRVSKENYFKKIDVIQENIAQGNIYEMNFCQEFYAENTEINTLSVYNKLNKLSKPPFATFLRIDDKYLISASPERYIRKENNHILSQPIKGTAKRSSNKILDDKLKSDLELNEKERSENIMIVDLVRNDLSKTAVRGSVKVPELCKVYSFDQVHQMISTVTSEISHTKNPVEVLRTTFPMGSMTGAPKVSAMQLIELLEETKRGLYSGSVGYFTPENNFDFNVVIRSILYNSSNKYISISVGGAITAKSTADSEYQECLLKAKASKRLC